MRGRDRLACCLLALTILGGCAGHETRTLPELDDWGVRRQVLGGTDQWSFSGRIGVSAGDEGFNGKIWWRQDGNVYRARISGPIGIGTVFINGNGGEVSLTDRDGVVTELEDAETELRARYGWTIPVTSLRYWALGIPDPAGEAEIEFGDAGLAERIDQRGWSVGFGRYVEGGGQPMPGRLTAVSGEIRVRLIIDDWSFRPL